MLFEKIGSHRNGKVVIQLRVYPSSHFRFHNNLYGLVFLLPKQVQRPQNSRHKHISAKNERIL